MARSKEQWKAQQRAQHTQIQSHSLFQMKRPGLHQSSVRPSAPPANSALFQLGRPSTSAPAAAPSAAVVGAERLAVLKPDPVQIPSRSGSRSGQVIDLTLDDEEEEEDEPMGVQVAQPPVAAATTAGSDAVKLSLLDGTGNEPAAVVQPLQQTEATSALMVPLAEDVESDVDEEWPLAHPAMASSMQPSAPPSVNDQASSHNQTMEDVRTALDVMRKTIPFSDGGQGGKLLERNDQADITRLQTSTPPLFVDDDDNDMEADVDEELPNQEQKGDEDAAGSPTTADRIVRVENLEDGEIFEEGSAPKPAMQAIMLEHQSGHFGMHPVDAMGIRPHLRNKKQKKRGKKKTKRKLEAMQMMHAPPGEMPPQFERTTRQRPFADAPPPGQYTLAMMRNCPGGEPMNVRPVFQDSHPALFRAGGLRVGVPHPPMRPPPQQRPAPPLPQLTYEDSQILRVNRQGNMEMLDGEAKLSLHTMFSEPPMHGGFKYRSVSMFPPPPVPSGPSHPLQRSVSDSPRLPPMPTSGRGSTTNSVASMERDDSGDFDLDSLRAAALRTKAKRPQKTSTPTSQTVTVVQSFSSSSSSSPRPTHTEEKDAKPTSPEIDKLRLEILRSIKRKQNRTANKAPNKVPLPTPPDSELNTTEKPDCARSADENEMNKAANSHPSAAQPDPSATKELSEPTLPKTSDTAEAEHTGNDGSSCETDKFTTTSEQNEGGDKTESLVATSSESAKPSAEVAVSTPEFRPLTACSQSLVIRLNPEDFSPRKSGDSGTRTKSTVSCSFQDAIKEMRRKIAEREKEQTNRLLMSAATRLSKQSCGSSSSPASSSSSPCQLSPGQVGTVVAQPPGATAASPDVSSSATESVKESPTGVTAGGIETKRPIGSISAQTEVSEEKEKLIKLVLPSPSETLLPAESAPGRESPRKPALEPQGRSDTSGVSTFVDTHVLPPVLQQEVPVSSDGRNGDPASQPCVKKSIEPVATA